MTAARVGSWSAVTTGDPSGTLTIGSGTNRILVVVVTAESTSVTPFSVNTLTVGGQAPSEVHSAAANSGVSDLSVFVAIWDEAAIAAMSGSSVSGFSHNGTEDGLVWQYATFADVLDQDAPVQFFAASGSSVDDLDVLSGSFLEDYVVCVGVRHDGSRAFNTWDFLTEIDDAENSQGFRHGLADGQGGENTITVVGDGTPSSMLLGALVLAGTENNLVFTGNGAVSHGDTHKTNLDKLLSAFDGRLSYSGGQWKIRASVWEASSLSLTESDIMKNSLRIRGSAPESDRFNTVRGTFIDPDRDYQAAEFPHRQRSAYLARDNNRVLERELLLPMTNDSVLAQALAYRLLEQSNRQKIVECTVNAKGIQALIGAVVDLTIDELSWTAKTFRVIEWRPRPDGWYDLTLREDDAAAYVTPPAGDFDYPGSTAVAAPDPDVPAPTNLVASAVVNGVKLDWKSPAKWNYDLIDVYRSFDNQWANAELIDSVRGETALDILPEGTVSYYWIRARSYDGEVSARLPDSDTSTVTATAANSASCSIGTLSNRSLVNSVSDPTDANCGIRFDSDGFVYTREGLGAWVQGEQWIGSCVNTDYELEITLNTGDSFTTGTVGSWLALGTDRTYELLQTVVGQSTNSATARIRRTDDDLVLVTRTISMDSTVE